MPHVAIRTMTARQRRLPDDRQVSILYWYDGFITGPIVRPRSERSRKASPMTQPAIPKQHVVAEFVRQSNQIEQEPDTPGCPIFDDHLRAAELVCERASAGEPALGPKRIHKLIMDSQPDILPGIYRPVRVMVGGEEKVKPALVPARMASLLSRARRHRTGTGIWESHFEFEAIHPFCDGNGRSGRLWMNELRIRAGLPWLTVQFSERWEYYRHIRLWEMQQRLLGQDVKDLVGHLDTIRRDLAAYYATFPEDAGVATATSDTQGEPR